MHDYHKNIYYQFLFLLLNLEIDLEVVILRLLSPFRPE